MSTFIGIVVAILILMAMGGGNPGTEPLPGPTVPSSAAMTVPSSAASNPGYANHCGFGPNDLDVRGVVRTESPTTRPNC